MNNQDRPVLRIIFYSLFFATFAGPAFGQSASPDEKGRSGEKVRIEYPNSAETPNHIVFQSVLYRLGARAKKDYPAAVGITQRTFGETSEAEAIAILNRIREIIAALEEDGHASRKRLLCGNGSLQQKDVYYKRMDALDDARIARLRMHYVLFMTGLNEPQTEAFEAYIESSKTKVYFRTAEHKSSYENADVNVLDTVALLCAEYGEEL